MEQTQVGMVAPELKITLRDGSTSQLSDTRGAHVLLFVNDPDCDDCRMTRIRLSADHNINQLLDDGLLRIVSIYPDTYTEEWVQSVANYNPRWIVGAAPDIDDIYDLRTAPTLYYLNPEGVILSKTLEPNNLLEAFHVVNSKMNR
ncbi:MAG: thioredoxin family protein [Muribaculaceae bacterium]|nr:thioredoxin family protein [Muribaculaceae bacterium]